MSTMVHPYRLGQLRIQDLSRGGAIFFRGPPLQVFKQHPTAAWTGNGGKEPKQWNGTETAAGQTKKDSAFLSSPFETMVMLDLDNKFKVQP